MQKFIPTTLELYPPLTPIIAPWVNELLADRESLRAQFEQYGSPLNVHALQPFADNYHCYRETLEAHGLRHKVFFARKANKCRAFPQEAKRLGFGVDTASYRELKECLDLGLDPAYLVLTAAIKEERLVELAIRNNVLIILDNLDECTLVERVAQACGMTAKIGVRISGFTVEGELLYSRFGFPVDEVPALVTESFGERKRFSTLRYQGLHFHLNGYSRQQRGAALLAAIACADELDAKGVDTKFIDIGGGFLVRYLENKTQWDTFFQELKQAVQGNRPPLTFGNNGLGLQLIDGQVHGKANVYPYFNETPKEHFLNDVLLYEDSEGATVASHLRDRDIELRMEPGRSLLDQAGVTIARVAFRKWDSRGDLLVGLEMNRTQMFSSSADFLLDPIVVSHEESTSDQTEDVFGEPDGPVSAYFVGAYCLEQDVILKRKINLELVPQIGDWVCFPNTAGYMMHFYESEAHLFELATNLIAEHNAESANCPFTYRRDEDLK